MSDETDLRTRVVQVLAEEVAPALKLDPDGIEVCGVVDGGIVQVRLHGACAGCPASIMTLVMGLEQELRRRLPEVDYLEVLP